ncbi:hypothetical protein POJ06DRAFT_133659 [Lipomyces tetrasporus]|uniref:DNA endonuclease activator Ctp1 C-terminal domain-containing protein n=1 Tax=Lipomyces tetrasporus TaxID=54092 RepID=A0AAD7VRM6_9ASCO|nr:uncharacterized protein POJ06DRAFT_133659 [Lipomyces tetrasporus]KAJ8099353.1 hypothetical protein POJ06DRAFT_133659 [Lipomyces tetrasporus]
MKDRELVSSSLPNLSGQPALPTTRKDALAVEDVPSSQDSVIHVPGTARADVDFYAARLHESILRERRTFDQFQEIWKEQKKSLENEVQYWRKQAEDKTNLQRPVTLSALLSDPWTPDEAERDRLVITSLRQELAQCKSALAKAVGKDQSNFPKDNGADNEDVDNVASEKIVLRVQLAAMETQMKMLRQQMDAASGTIADLEKQVTAKEAEKAKATDAFNAAKAKRQADLEVIKKWKGELQRRDLYQTHQQRTINSLEAQIKELLNEQSGNGGVDTTVENSGNLEVTVKQEPQVQDPRPGSRSANRFSIWRDHVRSASEPDGGRSNSWNHVTAEPAGPVKIKKEKTEIRNSKTVLHGNKENGEPSHPRPERIDRNISALTEDAMDDDYIESAAGLTEKMPTRKTLHSSQLSNSSQRTPLTDASQTLNHLLAEPAASLPSLDANAVTRGRAAKSLSTSSTNLMSTPTLLQKTTAKRPRSVSPEKHASKSITDQSSSAGHKSRLRMLSSETAVASSPTAGLGQRTPLISDDVARENKGRDRYSSSMQKPPGEREWTLEDFVINPNYNHNIDYAYHDVIRGRERSCVHGKDCRDCQAFYKLVGPVTPLPSGPKWNDNSPATPTRAESGTPSGDDAVRKMIATASRHRALWERPPSPVGFWRSEFPSTQEEMEEKQEARRRYQGKVQERYEEALKNGKYLFKEKAFRPMQAPPM